jgi:hypothetical protein
MCADCEKVRRRKRGIDRYDRDFDEIARDRSRGTRGKMHGPIARKAGRHQPLLYFPAHTDYQLTHRHLSRRRQRDISNWTRREIYQIKSLDA